MNFLKNKGLAVGLAASLVASTIAPNVSFAVEKDLNQGYNKQLERLHLQKPEFKMSQVGKEDEKAFSETQLVIKYKTPLATSEHRKAGGKLVKRFASLGYDVIEVQDKKKLAAVGQAYLALPNVQSVSRSAFGKKFGTTDPKASGMYHINSLNLAKAQSMAGKNKVKVGVIDTGIDANHSELKNKLIANVNIFDPLQKGKPDSHGTHVSGIIAAEKGNGVGGYGIAPNSDIVSIDVFNQSFFVTDYMIAEGVLEAIKQKVKVINMSLGSYYPSPIIKDAVQKAIDSGIVVVAAAGNDGANVLNYPAAFEGVISVGATDEKNQLAFFSTFGPSVDVVAPGQKVYAPVYDSSRGSSFTEMSGTSMASPVVAGAVSLLLSKYPNLSPYQVEYILTKTAKDIGDKGYDLKYGYGMIDLVKMLSFDPKAIPANPVVKEANVLAKAKDLGVLDTHSLTGKLQKLNQTDLYKTQLNGGDFLQVSLEGTSKYDLKFELLFFTDDTKKAVKKVEVNDVREGSTEGILFEAPENGTLVIAVKDSFGKYHEAGQSTYSLELQKVKELPDDGNTMETPVVVEALPYQTKVDHYYTNELIVTEEEEIVLEEASTSEEPASETTEEVVEEEEFKGVPGDSDFFKFKVPGNTEDGMHIVKVNLSDVPGINPTIKLHMIEKYEGEEMVYEMDQASNMGMGKGEELAFNAYGGQEFLIEVTNKPYFDEYLLMYGDYEIDYEQSYSSVHPYQLTIDSKIASEDEDGIPMMVGMEEDLMNGNIQEYVAKKKEIEEVVSDAPRNPYEEYLNSLREAAVEVSEGEANEGSLQSFGDEDWFAFKPKHSAIFEIDMSKASPYKPAAMEVVKYNEKAKGFDYIYSNSIWSWTDGSVSVEDKFTLGLQAGETYYFRVADPMYRPSFDPYQFTVKTKIKNTADPYETNDSFEKAIKVSTNGLTANFSSAGDVDTYYFKPGKDGVFGVSVTPGVLPAKYKDVPAKHKSDIDPLVVIIEDTNGNGKLEVEEEGNLIYVDNNAFGDEERSGFRVKKKSGYFISTYDYSGTNSSLVPYVLKIDGANRTDEDAGSAVKNNVPSKPIQLQKNGKNTYAATGYFNMTANKGDADHYKLNLDKDSKLTLTLETPEDIDGKVAVYNAKGVQVATSDFYGKGDYEILPLNLKKGSYYIKVEDRAGNASTSPYKIVIK
ncbi:S8 family serine peptidase [Cytobacillus sp. FJAT-53684]|uniref:S8 family serine peptidase n=1 Tax=Cytobacillus mangrovibacter TaxID=3299024 RepID=A0ABW6JYN5_9BACI